MIHTKKLIESLAQIVAHGKGLMKLKTTEISFPGVDVASLRKRTGLSQKEFASMNCFSVKQVRDWEEGSSSPDNLEELQLRRLEATISLAIARNEMERPIFVVISVGGNSRDESAAPFELKLVVDELEKAGFNVGAYGKSRVYAWGTKQRIETAFGVVLETPPQKCVVAKQKQPSLQDLNLLLWINSNPGYSAR